MPTQAKPWLVLFSFLKSPFLIAPPSDAAEHHGARNRGPGWREDDQNAAKIESRAARMRKSPQAKPLWRRDIKRDGTMVLEYSRSAAAQQEHRLLAEQIPE